MWYIYNILIYDYIFYMPIGEWRYKALRCYTVELVTTAWRKPMSKIEHYLMTLDLQPAPAHLHSYVMTNDKAVLDGLVQLMLHEAEKQGLEVRIHWQSVTRKRSANGKWKTPRLTPNPLESTQGE